MSLISNYDLLPSFRRIFQSDLQEYVEQYMTEERKINLKKVLEERTRYIAIVAENLIDEHNIHAMIRTSECFGLQDFYNIPEQYVHLKRNKSVNRGAFQWTHIYNYEALPQSRLECIQDLKSKGYRVFASSSHLSANYTPRTAPLDKPIAIIMGKEHEGVHPDSIAHCDGLISIPMYGFTESLNVSVATSLLVQPIVERLRESDIDWRLGAEEKQNLYYEWIWYSMKYPDLVYSEWLNKISQKLQD